MVSQLPLIQIRAVSQPCTGREGLAALAVVDVLVRVRSYFFT